MIEHFSIFGLHDERDVTITFERDKPYKILVAENGYGKTSILNAFCAVLLNDIEKLRKINFSKIQIKFFDKDKIYSIDRKDLLKNITLNSRFSRYLSSMSSEDRESFINYIVLEDFEQAVLFLRTNLDIPASLRRNSEEFVFDMYNSIKLGYTEDLFNNNQNKSKSTLNEIYKNINKLFNILYLPTYRRIEESLDNLYQGQSVRKEKISLKYVNFGMIDVDYKIKDLTGKILKSLQSEFQKLNGQMLSRLISDSNSENSDYYLDLETVDLILKRLPEEYLSSGEKDNILEMVERKVLSENKTLFQFIRSLTEVYSQQAETEYLIREFISICNKYLVNKEFVYDENKVEVKIVRKKSGQEIDLHMLSSGEKQIVSLFSNIYLEKEPNMVIFFDEPELSLSIEWQKMLLKDIIDSNKCKFLFATTHSPFIFDQLIEYTSDLSEYSKEI